MSTQTAWPVEFRVQFLREFWQRIGLQTRGRAIAIYGAGRHTRFLLDAVREVPSPPRVVMILDDQAATGQEIAGIPVRSPAAAAPSQVAVVIVSSDSIEPLLAQRAGEWAGNASGAPTVIRVYEGLPRGPYPTPHRYPGIWGTGSKVRNAHLPMDPEAAVVRLASMPERPRGEAEPTALPPHELRAGYHPDNDAEYIQSGRKTAAAIRSLAAAHGLPDRDLRSVLDWGCSSGRVLRHFADVAGRGGEVWGADICATSINWAQENLAPPLKFFQCMTHPPLPLPDASIDLVYANSVFTHIRELADTWLMELRRIIRPGGLAIVTILDEASWSTLADHPQSWIVRRCDHVDFTRSMTDDAVAHGLGTDPIVFWHTRGVRRRWSFAFDVLHFEPGMVPWQTGVVLRRP